MGVVKAVFQQTLLHDGYKHRSPPPVSFVCCTGWAPASRFGGGVVFACFVKRQLFLQYLLILLLHIQQPQGRYILHV